MKKSKIIWFTGMSGSGKSTLTQGLANHLRKFGQEVVIFDGDTIREQINKHLGFTRQCIIDNNLSIIELCKEDQPQYDYILVAVISPFEETRKEARRILGEDYYEVYVQTSLNQLINRDTKGLYQKTLSGELENFIGVDPKVPYEVPAHPGLIVDTDQDSEMSSIQKIIDYFKKLDTAALVLLCGTFA